MNSSQPKQNQGLTAKQIGKFLFATLLNYVDVGTDIKYAIDTFKYQLENSEFGTNQFTLSLFIIFCLIVERYFQFQYGKKIYAKVLKAKRRDLLQSQSQAQAQSTTNKDDEETKSLSLNQQMLLLLMIVTYTEPIMYFQLLVVKKGEIQKQLRKRSLLEFLAENLWMGVMQWLNLFTLLIYSCLPMNLILSQSFPSPSTSSTKPFYFTNFILIESKKVLTQYAQTEPISTNSLSIQNYLSPVHSSSKQENLLTSFSRRTRSTSTKDPMMRTGKFFQIQLNLLSKRAK